MSEELLSLNINEIKECLPHRYPMLLVDKIEDLKLGESAVGVKNVTFNEPFFQGHFPENPIMPGVLQIEAMAQVSAPILYTLPEYKNKFALFAGIDKARFKRVVKPGDRLDMEATFTKAKGPLVMAHAKGTVDGQLAVEVDLMVSLVPKP